MNLIVWLVAGGLMGWVASMIMRTDGQQGIVLNVVVGIVGAFLGGWVLAPLFRYRHHQPERLQHRRLERFIVGSGRIGRHRERASLWRCALIRGVSADGKRGLRAPFLHSVAVPPRTQEVPGRLPGLGRIQDAQVRGAEHRVVGALPAQVQLFRTLQPRALREVGRAAERVFGRHRCDVAVLNREIDEALVGIADHEHTRRRGCVVAAVQALQESCVGRAEFLADFGVRREAASGRRLKVIGRVR